MAQEKKGMKSMIGLGGEEEDEEFGCDYHIDQSGSKKRLIVECTECDLEPSLNNQRCLQGVINIMSEEMGIDSVILSHYEDTEYFGPAMDLLNNLVDFIDSIEDFTMRDPIEKYFDYLDDGSKRKLKCHDCQFNPSKVFPRIRRKFSEGIGEFEREFNRMIREIDRVSYSHTECEECTFSTLQDLDYLKKEYEELYKMTVREVGKEEVSDR